MKKITEIKDLTLLDSRIDAIQKFDELLNEDEEVRIIVYYGFAGIGKSKLIEWLQKNKCEKNKIPQVKVDFSLLNNEVFRSGFLETIITEFKDIIPSDKVDKFIERKQELSNRLIEATSPIQQIVINGESNQLGASANLNKNIEIAKEELKDAFISCLKNINNDITVIFLDSFENVSVSEQNDIWDLLNRLVLSIPQLRIVVASQHLPSDNYDKFTELNLLPLSKNDSNLFLEYNGINNEEFQNITYKKLAEGNFQITKFAIEAWNLAKSKGHKLELESIPQLIEQDRGDKVINWISKKILNHLDKQTRSIIDSIIILRLFNTEIVNCLIGQEVELERNYLYKFYKFSFINQIKEGRNKYHIFDKKFRLISLHSYYQEEPSKFQELHYRAYNLFSEKKDFINAIYHLFFVDKRQAMEEWNTKRRKAKADNEFSLVDKLFDIVQADELELVLSTTDKALILTKKAHYLRQIGNLDTSQKIYEEALKLYEENGLTEDFCKAKHGYATLLGLQEKYNDAKNELRILRELNPRDTYTINTLASLEVANNNYEGARDLLKQSIQVEPDNIFTINFLAQIELDTENWKSAIDLLEIAHDKFPDEKSFIQKLAKAHLERSNNLLKKARSISSKDPIKQHKLQTLIYEFITLADGGQINEARSTFREIMFIDSSFSDILERWARSEQIKRNYQKASVYYEIYLIYKPNDRKVLFSYGWLKHNVTKDRDYARKLFQKSLKIDSKRSETWFYLGEVERSEKNISEAANCYSKAYDAWEAGDGYYLSIDNYEEESNGDEIEIDSEDKKMGYEILWQWSQIEYKLGNFDKGRELYEKLYRIAFSHSKCRILVRWAISEYECQNYEEGDDHISRASDCCSSLEKPCFVVTFLEIFLSPLAGKVTSPSLAIARSMAEYSSHTVIANIVLSRLYRKSEMRERANEILSSLRARFPEDSNLSSEIEHLNKNNSDVA